MPVGLPDFPFRFSHHDRLVERRTDGDFLAAAWADPATRVLVMRGTSLSVGHDGLALVAPAEAPPGDHVLLGALDGVTYFLLMTDDDPSRDAPTQRLDAAPSPAPSPLADLRRLVDRLDARDLSLAVHATALGGWHRRHPHCSVCGAETVIIEAGASRRCPTCRSLHFPRTDPAVIMLVVDDADRCLLGHNAARAEGWFSTLAGFVEPGEAPEQAVAREVFEEAGVKVSDVTYVGSQPWPFPSSLMLGFFARAVSADIAVDGEEITEARWFTRDELRRGVESGELVVPTTVSIAGALVSSWYGGPLPQAAR